MATPIAHKGVTAGAKVQAMTMIDLLMKPALVQAAWDYFRNVQTKETKYEPLIRPDDKPAIELNKATMDKYREQMKKYYYDPTKYKTYLEQLGITYPTVKKSNRCYAVRWLRGSWSRLPVWQPAVLQRDRVTATAPRAAPIPQSRSIIIRCSAPTKASLRECTRPHTWTPPHKSLGMWRLARPAASG